MVHVPSISRPETSLFHRSNEFVVSLLGIVDGVLERNMPVLGIRLLGATHPAAVLLDVRQSARLTYTLRVALDARSAQEGWDVGVEEGGCFLKVGLVELLVGPLTVWVLVFRVDVAVNGLEEFLQTKLDQAVGDTETGCRNAVFRVACGESPEGAAAPVVACKN